MRVIIATAVANDSASGHGDSGIVMTINSASGGSGGAAVCVVARCKRGGCDSMAVANECTAVWCDGGTSKAR